MDKQRLAVGSSTENVDHSLTYTPELPVMGWIGLHATWMWGSKSEYPNTAIGEVCIYHDATSELIQHYFHLKQHSFKDLPVSKGEGLPFFKLWRSWQSLTRSSTRGTAVAMFEKYSWSRHLVSDVTGSQAEQKHHTNTPC